MVEGAALTVTEQAHYLTTVMRLREGDLLEVFNGRDGAYEAEIVGSGRREVVLRLRRQVAVQRDPPDLWVLFAPIKKARTDFIVEKATELGAARIQPVFTLRTNAERVRTSRLRAHAVEAAEQCGGTSVPEIAEPAQLADVLDAWPPGRTLIWCDERPEGARQHMAALGPGPAAVLVGPEGGFAQQEVATLSAMATPVTLGPRILRADTAVVAALTLWQAAHGDWR